MRRSVFPSFLSVFLAYTLDQERSLPLPRLGMHQRYSLTVRVSGTVGRFRLTFNSVDKSSRPLWSVIAILMFAPLAYVNVVAAGSTVCKWYFPLPGMGFELIESIVNWLVALSGLSTIFTWLAICLCQ